MHKLSEKNSYIPSKTIPFIGSVTNKSIFEQLDNFINNQADKILIIRNHENVTEQSGIGKKSFLIEYCHVLKTKYNIKWISAKSNEKLLDNLNVANSCSKINHRLEIPSSKFKNLIVLYDANDSYLIEKSLSKINLTKTKIIVISNSAFFKFSKFNSKYIHFQINFTLDDLKAYFSYFKVTKCLDLNELIQVIPITNLKPFILQLLVKFLKFNHLISFDELFRQNVKFDLNYLFEFLNNLNRIAFEICKVFSYVNHECVPKDLLISIFSLSLVQMQIPLNILNSLGLVEKLFENKSLYFKMNEYFLYDLRKFIVSNESLDDEIFLKLKIGKSLCQLLPRIQKRDLNILTKADVYFSSIEKFLGFINFSDLSVFEKNFANMLIQLTERYVQFSYTNKKDNTENLIKYAFIYYSLKKKFESDINIIEIIKIGNYLASIYFENGFYNQALEIYDEIEKFNSQIYTSDSLVIAQNIFNIANCYLKMYKYSWALYFFKDSLNIRLKLLGDRIDPEITDTIYLIGVCYLKIDNIKKAFLYHKKAYQMRVKLFGNRSLKTADSMNCLGECNFKMNIFKEARIFFEKSYLFRSQIVDQTNPVLIETLIKLIQVLINLKAFKEAWYILNKKIQLESLDSIQSIKISYLKGWYLVENGQINEAIIHLLQGFYNYSYSKQLDKEIKLKFIYLLANSYEKIGQKSKSDEYLVQATALNDEIRKQKITDRLDEIKTWTRKIVDDWMNDYNIGRNLQQFFDNIDGNKLVEYYLNKSNYSTEIEKKLNKANSKLEFKKEDFDKFYYTIVDFIDR